MPKPSRIVVAIHGVGNQSRAETIRWVARQFGPRADPAAPLLPLGYFSVEGSATVKVSVLEGLADVGFAEVYWADIPRRVTCDGDLLEETKAWGKTVVSRAEALYRRQQPKGDLTPVEFEQAAGVIEEIVESVDVIENLTFIADKMGIFKFDVAPLLRDYVNDVQVVTEFRKLRDEIVERFHTVMTEIVQQLTDSGDPPEVYIIAHSEGTVVSFIALLEALAGDHPKNTGWVEQVRGYMTIGSPIDKHLLLWDRLWTPFDGRLAFRKAPDGTVAIGQGRKLKRPIDWRNYYDHGDPIGFQLDTARGYLKERWQCEAFDFEDDHDIGFTRYLLPGKAHNDYWQDAEVFGHFIENVVLQRERKAPTGEPKTKSSAWLSQMCVPYLVVVGLMLAAVFLLLKGLDAYLVPGPSDAAEPSFWRRVLAVSVMLTGVTVVARVIRLLKIRLWNPWHWFAIFVLVAGFAIASWLGRWLSPTDVTSGLVTAAAALAFSGWVLPRRSRWGRRFLVFSGVAVSAFFIWHHVHDRIPGAGGESFTVVVLAAAAFIYLWWLAILVFDLSFIWHRYVRHAVAQSAISNWKKGRRADGSEPPATRAGPPAASSRTPSPKGQGQGVGGGELGVTASAAAQKGSVAG